VRYCIPKGYTVKAKCRCCGRLDTDRVKIGDVVVCRDPFACLNRRYASKETAK